MKNFKELVCRDLADYYRTEFSFDEDVLNKVSDGEVLEWNLFESKTIKFVVVDRSVFNARPQISLDGGEIDGDLIVIGSGNLKSLSVVNCAVSERIKIVNLVADKIEICGNSNAITFEKCKINDLHICEEIKEFISIDDCQIDSIEINGLVDRVLANGLKVDYFDVGSCDFKLLKIKGGKIKDFKIPSFAKVEFKDLFASNLQTPHNRIKREGIK